MRRVLFIASHLCSGSDALFDMLDSHPRIQGYRLGVTYEGPQSLAALTSLPHKLSNSSAVYMDELLFNYNISSKALYKEAHYVFLVRPPRDTLNEMVALKKYAPDNACAYYTFRLRRLRAMARRSGRGVLLTHDDIVRSRGLELVGDHMRFREPFGYTPVAVEPFPDADVPIGLLREAEESYEATIYQLRSLGFGHAKGD